MKKNTIIYLDFEVDKLTNSIENVISGEVFETLIVKLNPTDRKIIKKDEWAFNWHSELQDRTKQIYKLTTISNPTIIHGLISLTDKGDHIFMGLIESAKIQQGKE